jgi:hypothetical protein
VVAVRGATRRNALLPRAQAVNVEAVKR